MRRKKRELERQQCLQNNKTFRSDPNILYKFKLFYFNFLIDQIRYNMNKTNKPTTTSIVAADVPTATSPEHKSIVS